MNFIVIVFFLVTIKGDGTIEEKNNIKNNNVCIYSFLYHYI